MNVCYIPESYFCITLTMIVVDVLSTEHLFETIKLIPLMTLALIQTQTRWKAGELA